MLANRLSEPSSEMGLKMRLYGTLALLGACLTTTTMSAAVARPEGVLSGVGTAKDGDGVIVQAIEIRLQGIAAPEDNSRSRQPGGPEATANMRRLVDGQQLVCHPDGTKARGRPVATCTVNGKDVGELQVEQGFARDCPRYSGGRYAAAEQRARASGRNLSAIYPLPGYCN
jgi:micrococcal nuclease